jgi:chromate transporter
MSGTVETLLYLAAICGKLSLLSFGGAVSVLPELQREVVINHHWLSARDFSALYALCQASPGPNVLIYALIGWRLAGLAGVLTCTIMTFAPTALLTAVALKGWNHYQHHPWRQRIQTGLAPVTVGLIAAAAVLLSRSTADSWPLAGIVALSALLAIKTRLHPLYILLGSALIGLLC